MAGADGALDQVRGLALFNSLLQQRLRQFESEDLDAERQRLEEAERRESQAMQGAFQGLSNVLEQHTAEPAFDDELLSVATAVGAQLGVTIRAPGRSEDPRHSSDPVEAIARASRVRHRQVLLAGRWWENDCGPLIAYRAKDHRPLALLRHAWRGYSIFDPALGRRERLTAERALTLEPKAVMLYPRLPETATSPWSIPRFAMRGRGADLVAMLGLALLVTLLGMLVPQATAVLMDSAIPDANRGLIAELGLAMAMAALGAMMFTLSQGLIGVRIGMSTDGVSQAAVWDRLLSLRMRVFREYSTGDLFERAMSVSQVSRAINGQVMRSILLATTSLMNLVLMYIYSPPLATGALLLGVVVMLVTLVAGFFARKYHRRLLALEGPFFGFVVELVNAVSKIRVASAQRRSFARWAGRYAEQLRLRLKAQAIEDGVSVFNNVVPLMSAVVMYWSGVSLLDGQDGAKLSVGLFLAFYAAMGIFLNGATTLSNMVLDLMDTMVAANRVRPLLSAPVEAGERLHDPGRLTGMVEFRDVHFRYSAATPPVLHGVNFKIMPEEFVAFVGPSGSGKSTLFRLLLGFEDVNEGAVLFDGQDLAGLNAVMVRRQLGVVMQTARINAGSIFENIAVGAPLSVAEAWEAAEDAGFADDVRGMPMEMHTVVSEGGTNLSGGQRQRLLIARALARNPRVLLFDEATSALDNRTQAIVSSALERRKVTRLVIAHRLSTVRHADRIFVLSRGRIVESGTFDELVAGAGVFATMMARQIA
ncbi:MAG: NHLP bacteriocin export ABC transporter permease/ATPase subunit [Proteobacteria bacterium]|nr:NHLP bacteriocin export ABC transporter permease/ATPase subunit [Pseudomonadota bacterium]